MTNLSHMGNKHTAADLVGEVSPQQAAEIIDFVREIDGIYWGFQKRIHFGNRDIQNLKALVGAAIATKMGVPASDVRHFDINLEPTKGYSLRVPESALEVTLAHEGRTGSTIVADGFYFAIAYAKGEDIFSKELVKLAGKDFWSHDPQSKYELIVHNNRAPQYDKVLEALKAYGYAIDDNVAAAKPAAMA